MGNTFGKVFRVTTWGESHGGGVGAVVDGCPPLLPIELSDIQTELDRRKPGQSRLVSQRKELDQVEILSGVQDGLTLGTPIGMFVRNQDARSSDYDEMRTKFRPSHAEFAYHQKYGIHAWSGGGRASARETIGRVAAGAIAKKLLATVFGCEIIAWVESVGGVQADVNPDTVSFAEVEASIARCPDTAASDRMITLIEEVRKSGDSIGGVISCVVRGLPAGVGSPVFDKLEAELGKGILSLPACKGFEVGSGFAGAKMRGSEHNDEFFADEDRRVSTVTNRSGGIQGGISNGMPIFFRAAFKPTATIMRVQRTVTKDYENTTLTGRGRHDPCVLPRAVPIVEAMAALVLADQALIQQTMLSQFLNNMSSKI